MPRRNASGRRPQKRKAKKRKQPPNSGSFKPGPDERRHVFSTDESRAGYQAAWDAMSARGWESLAWLARKVQRTYGGKHGKETKGRRAG